MQQHIKAFFDSLAGNWDEIAVHPRERVAHVLDILGPIRGARVLDVGCGTGVLIGALLDRVGPEGGVLGLDLSPAMLALAASKHAAPNLGFVEADFLEWAGKGRFDAIVAYSCFPHFSDYGAFFGAAARSLLPGGRLLVAHIEGRQQINSHHGRSADEVSRLLPPAEEAAELAGAAGLGTLFRQDDGEYWILLAHRAEAPSRDQRPETAGF